MNQVNIHKVTNLYHIMTTWSYHIKSWTENNKDIPITVIRYEDLLDDPSSSFVKVLNALGFKDINQEKFDFALKQTEFKTLQKLETEGDFRENASPNKFFRVGQKEQWKEALTPKQIKKIEEDHGEVMSKFGYL